MKGAKSNGIDASLLCSNQEEADTLLISYVLYVFFKLLVKSSSWHCLIIALHRIPLLGRKNTLRLGASNKSGDVYVEPIYLIL